MSLTIGKDDHIRGSGPGTILVYGDYECPYTRALELVILDLRTRDGERYRGRRDEESLRKAVAG